MAASGTQWIHRPISVIYVDPDPDARTRTVDGLESADSGLTVDPVGTPTELREAIDAPASDYACVITEYDLGKMDALSLYDRLETAGVADVPFVLYTADGDELLASDAIARGLAGYVPKGDDGSIDRLLAQLRTLVDSTEQASTDDHRPDPSGAGADQPSLRSERDRFAALFEYSPDAIIVLQRNDADRIVDVNPAFETTFGYDREAITGSSLDDYLIPDDDERVRIAEAAGLGDVVTADVERMTADGSRDFLLRGFAAEIDGVDYEYVIYTDVTDRKQRERELERYRTLVETVGDPMYVLNATGRLEMVNDAMADTLGTTRDELVGDRPNNYMPAEDIERGSDVLLELLADDDRTWGTYEMTLLPRDGEPVVAENNVTPIVEDGRIAGSVGVIRDISDRKERERRIHRLHEGTRRLMAAESTDEVARVATEIARDALSLELTSIHRYEAPPAHHATTDATEPERDHGLLVPVASTDRTEALLETVPAIGPDSIAWDAFEAGETIVHGDVRRTDSVRNPETPIRSEVHIPLGEAGIFIASSTTPNDFESETITLARILAANVEAALERARREDELAARTAELERQNDRLDAFASTVSHDLRNPLTLASGYLETLEEHVDDEGEHYCEEIAWALERMDDLIENVLTLARSGQRLTETEPVALDAVVDQAHRTVDSELDIVRPDSLPTVEGDPERLCVCFENVFRNARDHVGDDVTITVMRTDDGFAIADDGPGIPPDEREAVLESGYSTDPDGTGFGLAIVSEVIEAHGWSIALEESDDGGLRLAVSLEG